MRLASHLIKGKVKLQLVISAVGLIVGFTMVLSCLQFKHDFENIISGNEDVLSANYLVLRKKVSPLSMTGVKNNFIDEDVSTLKKQSFITDASGFISGDFSSIVHINMMGDSTQSMSTIMYFETLPDKYVDIDESKWSWQNSGQEVPIIIPQMYMDAYNYGIAPTQDLPQVGGEMISNFGFKVVLRGAGKSEVLKCKIVGLSDRIPTILVPESFINYAQKNYGKSSLSNVYSRVIIEVNDPKEKLLLQYLDKNEFITNAEQTAGISISGVSNMISFVLVVLGCLIVLLALISFLQYIRFAILSKSDLIKQLIALGYNPDWIIKKAISQNIITILAVSAFALFAVLMIRFFVIPLVNKQFDAVLSINLNLVVWLVFGFITSSLIFLLRIVIRKSILKIV